MGVSRDGRYLLYRNTAANTNWDLWALPLSGEKKPFLAIESAFQEMIGEFSPDGRWIAYQTNESGQFEVFVRSFPEATTQRMISPCFTSPPGAASLTAQMITSPTPAIRRLNLPLLELPRSTLMHIACLAPVLSAMSRYVCC